MAFANSFSVEREEFVVLILSSLQRNVKIDLFLALWEECFVRIDFEEKKLRFSRPETIEEIFKEIELKSSFRRSKFRLKNLDKTTKIHVFKLLEENCRENVEFGLDRLTKFPEKFLRKLTRPNKSEKNFRRKIVEFGQSNFDYLRSFSILVEDLFWSMKIDRIYSEKHLKQEIRIELVDEFCGEIDRFQRLSKEKCRSRVFLLAFVNGENVELEIGINDCFRHGKEINKRHEIVVNPNVEQFWIQPEQIELNSTVDLLQFEQTRLIRLVPADGQKIELMRFRTRPRQNLELPLKVKKRKMRKTKPKKRFFLFFRFSVLCR